MRLVLFLIGLLFYSTSSANINCPIYPGPQLDIIQVDTGNKISRTGVLKMPISSNATHTHGSYMSMILEDQLIIIKDTFLKKGYKFEDVHAMQTAYDIQKSIHQSLLPALKEAVCRKPKIISLSYSGPSKDHTEYEYLKYASDNDTLIVIAAGNRHFIKDRNKTEFPAAYDIDCIVSIGTLKRGTRLRANYSNNAMVWVPDTKRNPVSGTSASTARAGAIAHSFRTILPSKSCKHIKRLMIEYSPKPSN